MRRRTEFRGLSQPLVAVCEVLPRIHPPVALTKTARYLYQAAHFASSGIYLFKLYLVRFTSIKFVKYIEFL
jgi:hypothetical protein